MARVMVTQTAGSIMWGIVRGTVSGLVAIAFATACVSPGAQKAETPASEMPASLPAAARLPAPSLSPTQSPRPQSSTDQALVLPPLPAGAAALDLNTALTRLIRSMNVTRLMIVGMDRAFARMPDKIGPIPKEKLAACAHAKLTPEMLEQVVRPAFALTFTDPTLPIELAVVFESPVGTKMIELVIANKTVNRASFTDDEVEEMNRLAKSPEVAAFLRDNGFVRLMRAITPYVIAAGTQARDACVRELIPREIPVTNPRPA